VLARLLVVTLVLATVVAALTVAPPPASAARANVAALQVALRAVDLYGGRVDGVSGPRTKRAVRRLQRRRGLGVDGVAGPRTRRALGRRGRPRLGSRAMRKGQRGWDIAALQFMLARRGFPSGSIDGGFGRRTRAAVRRAQRASRLTVDGVAGSATLRSLRRGRGRARRRRSSRPPTGTVRFFSPVPGGWTDGFGMRSGGVHEGLDFPAPSGTTVRAGGVGVTIFAGYNTGGYGNLVIVRHRLGFESWYAHLSRVTTSPGQAVSGGTPIGAVGSTGHSTGPHLHFEVRRYGTPTDPAPYMLGATASLAGARGAPVCERDAPSPSC
jgi:peptidoglycan hydrolase-like protein with peptidoglycan-binding domain